MKTCPDCGEEHLGECRQHLGVVLADQRIEFSQQLACLRLEVADLRHKLMEHELRRFGGAPAQPGR